MLIQLLLGFFLALMLALVGTPMAREAALRFGVVDAPDRNLKQQRAPVPYLGGLALFVSFLLALAMTIEFERDVLGVLLAAAVTASIGLIDDFGVLTPRAKVLGQVVAVFVLLKADVSVHLSFLPWWARLVVTVLWLVGMSNAFNLVDIMDGLAGGLAVISATFLLVVAAVNGRWVVAAFTVALLGALLGFLRYNFAPASIYMGDCGALFVGLTLGALAMVLDYTAVRPLAFLAPLYFFAVPLVDTAFVTVLRVRAGRKFYHGSPDHIPLRLRRRLGGGTVRTVLVMYGVAVLLGAAGLATLWLSTRATVTMTGVLAVMGLATLVWLGRTPMEG